MRPAAPELCGQCAATAPALPSAPGSLLRGRGPRCQPFPQAGKDSGGGKVRTPSLVGWGQNKGWMGGSRTPGTAARPRRPRFRAASPRPSARGTCSPEHHLRPAGGPVPWRLARVRGVPAERHPQRDARRLGFSASARTDVFVPSGDL